MKRGLSWNGSPSATGKQEAAERRDGDADDQRLHPALIGRPECSDHETGKRRDDQAERTDDRGEGDDRERHEQRPAQMIALEPCARPAAARQRNADAERQHQAGEQPRRGAGTELEAAHAGKVGRRVEGKQRQRDQRDAAVVVLRTLDGHERGDHGDHQQRQGEDAEKIPVEGELRRSSPATRLT